VGHQGEEGGGGPSGNSTRGGRGGRGGGVIRDPALGRGRGQAGGLLLLVLLLLAQVTLVYLRSCYWVCCSGL
jgi:hypothetical protein